MISIVYLSLDNINFNYLHLDYTHFNCFLFSILDKLLLTGFYLCATLPVGAYVQNDSFSSVYSTCYKRDGVYNFYTIRDFVSTGSTLLFCTVHVYFITVPKYNRSSIKQHKRLIYSRIALLVILLCVEMQMIFFFFINNCSRTKMMKKITISTNIKFQIVKFRRSRNFAALGSSQQTFHKSSIAPQIR